jgi:hypothetical protein
MRWPFKKKTESALIHSFETGLRMIQVSMFKNLKSEYSRTMAEEPAGVLAAQVGNYLKGEDVVAVMERSTEPLKSQIDRIKYQIPESAAKVMAESGSTREVVVATLRMKGVLEFMRNGDSYLQPAPANLQIAFRLWRRVSRRDQPRQVSGDGPAILRGTLRFEIAPGGEVTSAASRARYLRRRLCACALRRRPAGRCPLARCVRGRCGTTAASASFRGS